MKVKGIFCHTKTLYNKYFHMQSSPTRCLLCYHVKSWRRTPTLIVTYHAWETDWSKWRGYDPPSERAPDILKLRTVYLCDPCWNTAQKFWRERVVSCCSI